MSSLYIAPFGTKKITVPASSAIAVYCAGNCTVSRVNVTASYPDNPTVIGTIANGQTVFGTYTNATDIIIDATGGYPVYYEVGTAPIVQTSRLQTGIQVTPGTLNATGTLTSALMLTGIVTSTTGAGVTATLDTGTVMDASSSFAINEGFYWSVINTGGNTFTVTASSGHTVVGAGAVATVTSGRFFTRKTAANTFVTYRMS